MKNKSELLDSYNNFINTHDIVSIAVSDKDNTPWIFNAFYMVDKQGNLIFLSGNDTKHSKIIKTNSIVCATVYDHSSTFGNVTGIQIQGTLKEISFLEGSKYLIKFKNRFDKTLNEDLKQVIGSRFYKLTPTFVKYRNSKEFNSSKEIQLSL